jgi:monofunctional biosynthetic peptidoglycan transglycosylase
VSTATSARRIALRLAQALLLLAGAAAVGLGVLWLALPDPRGLATRNPATTALIEQRRAEAFRAKRPYRPQQVWVPLERISPRLVEAVVAAEDATFREHGGFDWSELRQAALHDLRRGRFARGASTITQQLAKNLYLGTEKSLLRKVKEALLTVKLERALDKRRILTLYLNVAEWGDGTFGAEAGARRHLRTSAAGLGPAEAVLLASMLPAPRRVDLGQPSAWLRARSTHLLERLHAEHQLADEEYRSASGDLARLLGGPAPVDEEAETPEEEPVAGHAPAPAPAPPGPPPSEAPGSPTTGQPEAPAPAPADDPRAPVEGGAAVAPSGPPAPQGAGTGGQSDGTPPAQAPPPQE